jgi:hypothetical protein
MELKREVVELAVAQPQHRAAEPEHAIGRCDIEAKTALAAFFEVAEVPLACRPHVWPCYLLAGDDGTRIRCG